MNEKDLIKLWNTMRTQIILAQLAPSLVLIGVFSLAAMGKFDMATNGAKYLAIGAAAVTGILAIISQYAAIREGESLVADLGKVSSPSNLAKRIADSRGLISSSAIAIVGSGVATFALVVWAVLGK